MINETKEMRDARHQLQTLSASDSLARSNMLRHVAACTQLLFGRSRVETLPGEPLVGAGFRLEQGEEQLFAAFTKADGIDRIYIAFDIDDAQGLPVDIGLYRKEGDKVICYGPCRLWSPADDGGALLVPVQEAGFTGYFAFRQRQPFLQVVGDVPGDLEVGFGRAQARYRELMKSADADALVVRGDGILIRSVGRIVTMQALAQAA